MKIVSYFLSKDIEEDDALYCTCYYDNLSLFKFKINANSDYGRDSLQRDILY